MSEPNSTPESHDIYTQAEVTGRHRKRVASHLNVLSMPLRLGAREARRHNVGSETFARRQQLHSASSAAVGKRLCAEAVVELVPPSGAEPALCPTVLLQQQIDDDITFTHSTTVFSLPRTTLDPSANVTDRSFFWACHLTIFQLILVRLFRIPLDHPAFRYVDVSLARGLKTTHTLATQNNVSANTRKRQVAALEDWHSRLDTTPSEELARHIVTVAYAPQITLNYVLRQASWFESFNEFQTRVVAIRQLPFALAEHIDSSDEDPFDSDTSSDETGGMFYHLDGCAKRAWPNSCASVPRCASAPTQLRADADHIPQRDDSDPSEGSSSGDDWTDQ